MKKTVLLVFIALFSIMTFASVESFCPSVDDIHRAEDVDLVWYVSGLQQPYDNNRYVVRVSGALYTLEGHKYSVWTEPFSAPSEDDAKAGVKKLLPSLRGPMEQPTDKWFWGDELCWYKLNDGTYVVARFWW